MCLSSYLTVICRNNLQPKMRGPSLKRKGFSFCQLCRHTAVWGFPNLNSDWKFLQPLRQYEPRSECRLADFWSSLSVPKGIAPWSHNVVTCGGGCLLLCSPTWTLIFVSLAPQVLIKTDVRICQDWQSPLGQNLLLYLLPFQMSLPWQFLLSWF